MRKYKVWIVREEYSDWDDDWDDVNTVYYEEKKKYILVDQDIIYPGDFEDLISWASHYISKEEALEIAQKFEIQYEVEIEQGEKEIKDLPIRYFNPYFPYKEGMTLYSKDVIKAIEERVDSVIKEKNKEEEKEEETENEETENLEEKLFKAIFGDKEEKEPSYQLYTFYPYGTFPEGEILKDHKVITFENSTGRFIGMVVVKETDRYVEITVPDEYKGQVIGKAGANIKKIVEKYNIQIKIK